MKRNVGVVIYKTAFPWRNNEDNLQTGSSRDINDSPVDSFRLVRNIGDICASKPAVNFAWSL